MPDADFGRSITDSGAPVLRLAGPADRSRTGLLAPAVLAAAEDVALVGAGHVVPADGLLQMPDRMDCAVGWWTAR